MKLLFPDDVRAQLEQRYRRRQRQWLGGEGAWPIDLALGSPTERAASESTSEVRAWVDAWMHWRGPGLLQWTTRRWARLGTQQLPASVTLDSPRDVALWVGDAGRWDTASRRYAEFRTRWTAMPGTVAEHFDTFADYVDADFARLGGVVEWLAANPESGCYLRQLPIAGVHTKWIESRRRVIAAFVAAARAIPVQDFYTTCGVRRPASNVRFRLLCPELRARIGGLQDIAVSVEQLARLDVKPRTVVVVENQETGIALPDMSHAVAFVGLGNAITMAADIPWLAGLPFVYWGDIDTYGLAIVSRARSVFRRLRTVLMDEVTLCSHAEFWGVEKRQHGALTASALTDDERALFDDLKSQRWGVNVRLEQERLPWPDAMTALICAVDAARDDI